MAITHISEQQSHHDKAEEKNLEAQTVVSSSKPKPLKYDANADIDEKSDFEPDNEDDIQSGQSPVPTNVLGRMISKTRSNISIEVGPPPDGGWTAWIQVLMVALITLNTWGYINSFGVFQTYYSETLNRSQSSISWIGSVQVCLVFGIGTFSGRATDAGYFKLVYAIGTILQTLGTFTTSVSKTYLQLFLSQGLCTGLGNGMMFCPCISLAATYFLKNRALALSLTASGTAIGGLIFPSIVEKMLPQVGFGWTVRTIAFIMLAISVTGFFVLKQRVPPRTTGPIFEASAWKELPYLFYAVGMFFNLWAIYFAFYYVGSFGKAIIGISDNTSINMLLIMNGVGFVGRLIPGYCADKYSGPINFMAPMALLTALLSFLWPLVSNEAGLFVWSAIYGITASGIQGLFPGGLASLTTDPKKQGVRMGMVMTLLSIALLTGCPLGGALISADGGRYLGAQLWSGACMILGGSFLFAARRAKTGSWVNGRA
ncbi:MAG: hypothetical protein M1834_001372 [Cirrosporium novae-zelandiae]|nr:MAG: hypothetical protein M1834_001372 [Cirrosporium novae-zelandiae]